MPPYGYRESMNPWLVLAAAIVVEVAGTLCLKLASIATVPGGRIFPGIGVAVFYGATLVLMAIAMKTLDASTTYVVWSGVGMALVTVASVYLFNESFGWPKVAGIALVAAGVMVLHAWSEPEPGKALRTSVQSDLPAAPEASPDQR
jgi:small multidrug resistance pump